MNMESEKNRTNNDVLEKGELRLIMKINDPLGLAKKESKMARMFSGLAPELIKKEVYKRIGQEIIESLKDRGIDNVYF